MDLGHLKEKIEKLIFVNKLIFKQGDESKQALYTLEDEVMELEYVYKAVRDAYERCL